MRSGARVFKPGMCVLLLTVAGACGGAQNSDVSAKEPDSAQPAATDSQPAWTVLFDGSSTAAWRGFKKTDLPSGWQIVDGALTRVSGGGDIITRDQFGDFELELEWKLAPKGNSGIMFRVTEADSNTYRTGPEMQVLDDAGHQDGKNRLTSAGSNYALHAAPAGVVKPVGEWNQVRLIVRGAHVEHWLNGQKTAEYELGSPEWNKLKAAGNGKTHQGMAPIRKAISACRTTAAK